MFKDLFSKRGLSLDRLHLVLQLEEAGSLVKAAEGNEVRQAQYSRQIKQLSEYFGIALAERQGRELKLTPNGQRLARLIRETFLGLEDFQQSCAETTVAVTIGAGDSVLQWLLLPRIRKVQEKLKNVRFTLLDMPNQKIADMLSELKLDFGVMRDTAVPPKHRKERLFQMEFSIFAPTKLLPKGKKADHKYALQSLPLVRHTPSGELVTKIDYLAEQENIALNNCLTCEGFPQACRAVQCGNYAAILPTIARGDLKSSEYTEIEWPALKAEARWIVLAWNPRQVSLRSQLEKVANCLKAELMKS